MESNVQFQENGQYVKENLVQIKRFLNSKTDEIINAINQLVSPENEPHKNKSDNPDGDKNLAGTFRSRNDMGRRRFMALLQNSSKANSVNEVVLFIEYQAAKASKSEGWENVAPALISSLNKTIKCIFDDLEAYILKDSCTLDEEDIRLINLLIMEKYMGYLYWKATILISDNDKSNGNYNNKKGGRR